MRTIEHMLVIMMPGKGTSLARFCTHVDKLQIFHPNEITNHRMAERSLGAAWASSIVCSCLGSLGVMSLRHRNTSTAHNLRSQQQKPRAARTTQLVGLSQLLSLCAATKPLRARLPWIKHIIIANLLITTRESAPHECVSLRVALQNETRGRALCFAEYARRAVYDVLPVSSS